MIENHGVLQELINGCQSEALIYYEEVLKNIHYLNIGNEGEGENKIKLRKIYSEQDLIV